ncbi:MAG: DUF4199 domain-containing protein [Adhaeribacter sp.]
MNENYSLEQAGTESVTSVALRYGLLTGFISVIYSLILYVSGLSENKLISGLGFLILIGGIVMAHTYFKKENGGYMTYGQGLGIGSLLSVIVGVMSGIFMYIYIKFIDSAYLERIRDMQMAELEKRNMSEEQMEHAMAMTDKLMGPEMLVVWSIIGSLLMGFLISLLISAFTKRTRPEYE